MRFREDDDVIEALAADAPQKSLADRVHQRRLHGGAHDTGTGARGDAVEDRTELVVAISDEELWPMPSRAAGPSPSRFSFARSNRSWSDILLDVAAVRDPTAARRRSPYVLRGPPTGIAAEVATLARRSLDLAHRPGASIEAKRAGTRIPWLVIARSPRPVSSRPLSPPSSEPS